LLVQWNKVQVIGKFGELEVGLQKNDIEKQKKLGGMQNITHHIIDWLL
jgi:hypothetical protein